MNTLARQWGLLLTAVMFLTRIPVPALASLDEISHDDRLRRSARYFSLVGAMVGLASGAAVLLFATILPPQLCIALSMALTLLLTGAFHEDGWADVCDAFGGGRDRDDILRIMSDPRVGAFGVIGMIMMLGIKFLALADVPWGLLPVVLIAGHAFSRAFAVVTMACGTYARASGGKTRAVAAGVPAVDAVVALVLACLSCILFPTITLVPVAGAVIISAAAAVALYGYFRARLGGYSGDCLGAIQQLSEVMFYLAVGVLVPLMAVRG